MLLPPRFKQPTAQLRIGLAMLLVASLGRFFLRPTTAFPADRLDAVEGFLYGLAIGAMLLALIRGRLRGGA